MRMVCATVVLLGSALVAFADPVKIVGETKYTPHALVRLKAEGVDAKAALLWRVHPSQGVQRATSPRGVLEFAAPPGTYEVELLAIASVDGTLTVDEARVTVEIAACGPKPDPKPDPKPEPKPDGTKPDAARRRPARQP